MSEDRDRPQLTIGELARFMTRYPKDTLVSVAPSEINDCEPEETQEFILMETSPAVALEYDSGQIVIGFVDPDDKIDNYVRKLNEERKEKN